MGTGGSASTNGTTNGGSVSDPVGNAGANSETTGGNAGNGGADTMKPLVDIEPNPSEWHQDAHDPQRSGFTPIEPETPWEFVWTWNGSGDDPGSLDGHFYEQPEAHTPWEARTVTGGGLLYAPASDQGLFALSLETGEQIWHVDSGAFNATPAFDPSTKAVFAGSDNGTLYKIDAATGTVSGTYDAGAPLSKPVLIAGDAAYAVDRSGTLHKIDTASMEGIWTYQANSAAHTLPAYSAAEDVIIFGTADLFVHAVNGADGQARWRVKPNPDRQPGYPYEFEGGWPVIAEQHGVVFMRMNQGIDLIFLSGSWALDMDGIRAQLQNAPEWKNLFALDLSDGSEAFIPAVAPQGVEDFGDSPNLRVHSFPVIKTLEDGTELAYQSFRAAPQQQGWDERWDSHIGEMMLDDNTVPGFAAGDLRFIDFTTGYPHITDENCPLTMAGDTLFFSHWAGTGAHHIDDRSDALGTTFGNALPTTRLPSFGRSQTCASADFDADTHFTSGGVSYNHEVGNLCSGRSFPGPAFYSYFGIIDPPTPSRGAYSEGVLPRYTYVSGRYIVFEGNGGDLVVLRHSGEVPAE